MPRQRDRGTAARQRILVNHKFIPRESLMPLGISLSGAAQKK
jgi:hypothetical protein